MTRKEALSQTLRTLKVRPELTEADLNELIEIAADKLSLMAGPHREAAPAAFQDVSFSTADSEKKQIEHLARKLAKQIETIHKPTVIAFAELGYLRDRLGSIALELKNLSAAARQAKIDPIKSAGWPGREKKGPIEVVRRIVANAYNEITGKDPSSVGDFEALSRKIIGILDLDDKPGGFAKSAYDDFRKRKQARVTGKNPSN